jgi:hypothetical protein
MAHQRISLVTKLQDRWGELVRRWRIPPTVIARARHRCEMRLPDVCTYWGKEFHEIVSPPPSIEEIVLVCPPCGNFLRDNPEWAAEKGLKKSAT